MLSSKAIKPSDRLIVAIDTDDVSIAKAMVNDLGEGVSFYKIGMQFLMSGEYFSFIDWLKSQHKKVFVDLKFFDVPQTVRAAVAGLAKYGVDFATIHGNDGMMLAAAEAKGNIKLLAVSMLTSLDAADALDLGFPVAIQQLVTSRASRALKCGCDGVVSSGLEVSELSQQFADKLFFVCPGIRAVANEDDQKRTVDVKQAFLNGADYIVVGRPVRQPKTGTPRQPE